MKLSRIYSNLSGTFSPIDFNAGPATGTLNVVMANVKRRKEREADSHNLGKTTLIYLVDFLLLRDISDGHHFLAEHAERFHNFIFFIEIALHSGGFITVRRAVAAPTKISFKKSAAGGNDYVGLPDPEWDHIDVNR
jgi:uncharacterized protein YydD (DUF2326 family)